MHWVFLYFLVGGMLASTLRARHLVWCWGLWAAMMTVFAVCIVYLMVMVGVASVAGMAWLWIVELWHTSDRTD